MSKDGTTMGTGGRIRTRLEVANLLNTTAMTVQEVAEFLRISRTRVYQIVKKDKLPTNRGGKAGSPRERHIAYLVAAGFDAKSICHEMNISSTALEAVRNQIRRNLVRGEVE